ncbi:MAG: armadillo-type protein, partial [Benniella sp.]
TQYDIQRIVSNYVTDPEPRVRKNACKALLELHRQGFKLGLALYDVATQALLDDYQEVRLEGLDLIFLLSGLYPDQVVQDPSASQVQATRLVDDAFIRICDMVNDSSMIVRAKACSLLGRFRSVEYKFLSQTFSKQIMARLRVDVAPKNLAAGPAQKQAQLIATPEGDQDVTAQQVRLLDSGACGAFVHGLEDEYQDVRNAAINSICELCLQNPEFSVLALDYMVDMFMDEIDYVRLNALTSLYKIGSKSPITFDTEQLQITLGVLEDADRDVRESTHRMLGVITMATADGMTSFLTSIESNVKRFPEDQLSIYQCIRAVARRHGAFVESIVPEILNLNKMYLPIEENVESMLYGGHLILIFNAAISNPRILSMLPKYTYKHYTYLRDKYPNCFPEPSVWLDVGSTHTEGVSSAYATTISAMRVQTEQDAEAFYERILRNLDRINLLWRSQRPSQTNEVSGRHRSMVLQQIAVCQRDLRYIVSVHAKQGRNAEFADMFLECCELLLQIQEIYDTPSFIMLAPALSAQLFRLSYYMDHTFLGLDATTKISVGFFRVLANLMDQPEVDHRRVQTHRAVLEHLRLAVLQALKSPSTQEVIKLMSNIVVKGLELNRIRAQVTRPLPNRDTPLEVHPTFPFLIHVEGIIHHISDTTGVAVQVSFPQNVVRLYYPPPDHFTLMEDDQVSNTKDKKKPLAQQGATPGTSRTYRLRTSIEVYPDAAWGYTAAELGITLTRSFQPDLVGHDEFICRFAQDVVTEKRQNAEGGESSSSASASRRPQQPPLQPRVETMDRTSSALTEQSQSTLEISKRTSYFITRQRTYSK